jgi:hypothetical protein
MCARASKNGDLMASLGARIDPAPELTEEGAGWSEISYQFRIFLPRCETYAIRFAGSRVTRVHGPLEYDEVLWAKLPNFPYESQVDCLHWVKANFDDFVPCDAEYEESTIRI